MAPHHYGMAQCLYSTLDINGLPAHVLVDSGVTTSCLSATFYGQHQHRLPHLWQFNKLIARANGILLPVASITPSLSISWGGTTKQHSFIVMYGTLPQDGILGMDLQQALDVVTLTRSRMLDGGKPALGKSPIETLIRLG